MDAEIALGHLALQQTPFGLVGHTHVPMLVVEDRTSFDGCQLFRLADGERVDLDPDIRIVLNPGSVGQPRDGDPRASYGLYDSEANTITLQRVEYDIAATQKLMADEDLPGWLIERLAVGR
jgi:diadenosine tetraphosphatase ApaH/serine/threonine PP2A family protein phosphatase